jgi:hypothetical protein
MAPLDARRHPRSGLGRPLRQPHVATIGLLAIAIGLTTFRRGERWAWFAIAVFVAAAVLTELRDRPAWGGWFTLLFLGLVPLLGLLLSAKSFFGRRSSSTVRALGSVWSV